MKELSKCETSQTVGERERDEGAGKERLPSTALTASCNGKKPNKMYYHLDNSQYNPRFYSKFELEKKLYINLRALQDSTFNISVETKP